jgi:hypothetical protein
MPKTDFSPHTGGRTCRHDQNIRGKKERAYMSMFNLGFRREERGQTCHLIDSIFRHTEEEEHRIIYCNFWEEKRRNRGFRNWFGKRHIASHCKFFCRIQTFQPSCLISGTRQSLASKCLGLVWKGRRLAIPETAVKFLTHRGGGTFD